MRMQQEIESFEGGWIYKTAEELKNDLLMIDTNVKTIRKYLRSLVEKGFLLRRNNPDWKAIVRINIVLIYEKLSMS